MGGYILRTRDILNKQCPFLSRSSINLYNGERMGMIDKGVPEIRLFQSNGIKHFCPIVACIVKHADPQINSVQGVFNKFINWVDLHMYQITIV